MSPLLCEWTRQHHGGPGVKVFMGGRLWFGEDGALPALATPGADSIAQVINVRGL